MKSKVIKDNNINFDDGYKEFYINNDPSKVIRIDTGDIGFLTRAVEAKNDIITIASEMTSLDKISENNEDGIERVAAEMNRYDKIIREKIDYIFDSNVSDIVFGSKSCLATSKGIPLYLRFFEAVIPKITAEIEEEKRLAEKEMRKYTDQAQTFAGK